MKIAKTLFLVMCFALYTLIVFHYSASAVLTFQHIYSVTDGYEVELWGQIYSYK